MNEVTKSMGAMPDLGASFVQVSSDATRRLCEQGQSVAKTIGEWNTEGAISSAIVSLGMARYSGARGSARTSRRSSPFNLNGCETLLTTT